MKFGNTDITLDEDNERLKIVIPLQRNLLAIVIYTILAIVWIGALGMFVYLLFNPPTPRGIDALPTQFRVVWVIGVILWLYVWMRVIGRMVLKRWQFHLANREILMFSENTFIIRRPVSLFGLTDAFNMQYVSPFFRHTKYSSLAFQYGNVNQVLFATTLDDTEQSSLMSYLNRRFFPGMDDDDDEE